MERQLDFVIWCIFSCIYEGDTLVMHGDNSETVFIVLVPSYSHQQVFNVMNDVGLSQVSMIQLDNT